MLKTSRVVNIRPFRNLKYFDKSIWGFPNRTSGSKYVRLKWKKVNFGSQILKRPNTDGENWNICGVQIMPDSGLIILPKYRNTVRRYFI